MIDNWPERYLGQPWKIGGRSYSEGFDCWGFLRWVYECEFNIEISEHVAPIDALAPPAQVVKEELTGGCWKEIVNPKPGDVMALGKNGTGFSHVGVYVLAPAASLLHIIAGGTSNVTTLKALYRQGYGHIKYYRHVTRDIY